MARTPLQVLEDDVREEARRSTAKKLVALYWAIPAACFGAALYCVYRIPGDAMFFASLAAILAAAVGASLGFGLTWTFWVVAKEDEVSDRDAQIAELRKRPTQKDVDDLERAHAEAIAARDAEISKLEERPTESDIERLSKEKLAVQEQLARANDYWKSQIARAQADVSAKNAELEREKSVHERELAAKEAEIAELKNMKRKHASLFDEFRSLTHDEQRQIVRVMLSEPGGLAPTEDQRKHIGEWVTMKDFLRHDPGSDRMHLVDGVEDMLLENPGHVYGLMAARVSDLEKAVADAGVSRKQVALHGSSRELDRLRIQNAALKSNALEKDRKISSLEKRVDGLEAAKEAPGNQVGRSDDEMYALIGAAGLSDLLWAYDYIDKNGPIPANPLGGKMESRRIQRLVNKGVLVSLGGMLSDGFSYDMAKEWSLFVHRERAEIERRLDNLNE